MSTTKHNWTKEEIIAIYKPMMDLLYEAAPSIENITIKRGSGIHFIVYKTGGCPEDCGYCPQAAGTILRLKE
jgi:biotin synthase